ncbi:enoyl-CoA hydratase/isomerase family protein [Pseudohoeflea coraliihabitans]|uniref:Enoyl-CoA hydratase/isomerase family protein n=1 Tax=Pseudohoeflea coraliihabitans TaxID=2860393 RepID=A0ABS6WR35_9HYPH|nr:enoyl-CoA hydratase/isomerase family protein [Pseudohoeflea sp. DP4N28-3]MBW3098432.1 enoyl-CoA hydratase/isomerase family protein [Pseudohoeflea sp. DP4N28-3]
MSKQKCQVEIRDGVAVMTLNNPPMNVVTLDMTREMNAAVKRLADDPQVGALVLTGAGDRAFCAGSDIKEFPGLVSERAIVTKKLGYENETYGLVANFPKPTVAAIERLALGGGLELAAGCDLIVVSEDARVGLPEILLGGFPGSGGTVRVTRRIGLSRANEMMLLGDMIDAETALNWGLANRIAPRGRALETATDLARRLAQGPAQATYACKMALRYACDLVEAEAIRRTLDLSEGLSRTADFSEGVAAFISKRQAAFGEPLDVTAFEPAD